MKKQNLLLEKFAKPDKIQFIATEKPRGDKVLAVADTYRNLVKKLEKRGLRKKPYAVAFTEPTKGITAYFAHSFKK